MKESPTHANINVSMIGAREHYAVPRMLARAGCLGCLYTDLWSGGLRRLPGLPASLKGRWHPELSEASVRWSVSGVLLDRWALRKCRASRAEQYRFYAMQGQGFAQWVLADLQRRGRLRETFLGFQSAALETLEAVRDAGGMGVLDQIDPGRVEEELVMEECGRWPGWQRSPEAIPEIYFERVAREWQAADRVIVNSAWSRNALIRQGVPEEKLRVVPLGYEDRGQKSEVRGQGEEQRWQREEGQPLRVLWLGTVNLRKGIPYLVEAARMLDARSFAFRVAGPVEIGLDQVELPGNMTFVGRVPRLEAEQAYRWADVFVLPTVSDGFAITQLEAMAQGLPVLTTPNCGEVVRDGVDGAVVPARDAAALARVLGEWEADRERVEQMSAAARERVKDFSLENVSGHWIQALA